MRRLYVVQAYLKVEAWVRNRRLPIDSQTFYIGSGVVGLALALVLWWLTFLLTGHVLWSLLSIPIISLTTIVTCEALSRSRKRNLIEQQRQAEQKLENDDESNDDTVVLEHLESEKEGEETGTDRLTFNPDKGKSYEEWIASRTPEEVTILHHRSALIAQYKEEIAEQAKYDVDSTEYWNRHPGKKYFIKRLWRIVVAWIAAIAASSASIAGMVHFSTLILIPIPVLALLLALWYTMRRYYKWRNLRVQIIGNWGYIIEPKSRFYFLNGQDQRAHLMYFNNVVVKRTFWERMLSENIPSHQSSVTAARRIWSRLFNWPMFNTATIEIQTSIPDDATDSVTTTSRASNDKFRLLTDMEMPEEFAEVVSVRNDEITRGLTPRRRIGLGSSGSLQ